PTAVASIAGWDPGSPGTAWCSATRNRRNPSDSAARAWSSTPRSTSGSLSPATALARSRTEKRMPPTMPGARPSGRLPAGGLVGVARPPGLPRDVPVPQAVIAGQDATRGVLHRHRVTAFDHVLEPGRGLRGDVDAAVRDVP